MRVPTLTASDNSTVEAIKQLSEKFLVTAEDADSSGALNATLRGNIQDLLRIGFFGSSIPRTYGGLELSSSASKLCLKLIAASCGVTAFTQQQLHAGGNFIGTSKDESLKQELLPQFASGENICGVGFSHLRRKGSPKVVATRTEHGFRISGELPWISAWSLLDSFILGATVTDGSTLFCYVPISDYNSQLIASAPMHLSTMDASETVQLAIKDVELPQRFVISELGPDHMESTDYRNITGNMEMPLGCAIGSAAFLKSLGEKNGRATVIAAAERIVSEASRLEELGQEWNGSRYQEPEYLQNALKARAGTIKLAFDSAAAAISAAGGSAHLFTSPAQRRYREAAFYATQAQTSLIQQSLLEAFIDG